MFVPQEATLRNTTLMVEATRGELLESVHAVAVAVTDADGRVVASSGDPATLAVLRSAAKPFQAMPLVDDGAAQRFGITPAELAIACASHNGESAQVDVVRGLMARIGCTEGDLVCGPHRSLAEELGLPDDTPADRRAASRIPRTPITSNCSGKHTGMLALARHHDWPTQGYEASAHPVQQRCKQSLAQWTGVPAARIGEAVDGCGVVCFQLPLQGLAAGFARLARASGAGATIRNAMLAHPELIAGKGRLCTDLMIACPGVLAKVGAEGVYAAALVDRGLGIAIKVLDGHNRAAGVALLAVLDQLGVTPAPTSRLPCFATWTIGNTRGHTVGSLRSSGALSFV